MTATRRDELARHLAWIDAALESAEPSAVAALLRERRITLNEMGEEPKEQSKRDELRERRAKRRPSAS